MFRLHLRRPHKADQSPVCCTARGGGGGGGEAHLDSHTNLSTCAHALTHFRAFVTQEEDVSCKALTEHIITQSPAILFGPRQNV